MIEPYSFCDIMCVLFGQIPGGTGFSGDNSYVTTRSFICLWDREIAFISRESNTKNLKRRKLKFIREKCKMVS